MNHNESAGSTLPVLVTILSLLYLSAPGAAATHPLDGLDTAELRRCTEVLRGAGHLDGGTLVIFIDLEEPPKSQVLAWSEGHPIPRAARAVLRRDGKSHEIVVDLTGGTVTSVTEIESGQVAITLPEIFGAIQAAPRDKRMREGLAKRGIGEGAALFCAPRTVGNFGTELENTRRLVKVDCFDLSREPSNAFASPIEGLFAVFDLDSREVIDVVDTGVVPTPPGKYSLATEANGPLRHRKPVEVVASQGPNFTVEGSLVSWENWRFHLRWDMRSGLVLSAVSYQDKGRERSVLYQGHLAELYVPYQDPTAAWYYRNYFDQGEYGLGTTASRLVPGADCPQAAHYLSPQMANAAGGSSEQKDRICLFERATGEPTWRHYDLVSQALESRPDVELVVRFIATVGNYDYLFDWIFDAKGRLTFRGGASGLDAVKGVEAKSLADASAEADTAWGPLIAPGRAGINHDHFFSLRLDVDVDGAKNRFVRDRLVAVPQGEGSRRTSLWRVMPEVLTRDSDAKLRLDYARPSLWRVLHAENKNSLGYPVSYLLKPGTNALPLVDEDDPPLARAGFANYHLWVTPYDPRERYAAGTYPNQSTGGLGLPAWTSKGRDIDGEDIVLWYSMGFHHVPSAEDWPVYNVGWHSVTLKPYNFFDQNPAMDLPTP